MIEPAGAVPSGRNCNRKPSLAGVFERQAQFRSMSLRDCCHRRKCRVSRDLQTVWSPSEDHGHGRRTSCGATLTGGGAAPGAGV